MWFGVVSVFPDMFEAVTRYGITRRAVSDSIISLKLFNPRVFANDTHRTVDDRPYGGGPGMVMMAEPMAQAVDAASAWARDNAASSLVIHLTPQGKPLEQRMIEDWVAHTDSMVLLCGRYEGVDERVVETRVDQEVSIGDFVISGGELGAMLIIDAVARRLPGVLGHPLSAEQDSFQAGLLDCPHYTRPEVFEGLAVPDVLLSGHHERIAAWRLEQSKTRTKDRRPDLWRAYEVAKLNHPQDRSK